MCEAAHSLLRKTSSGSNHSHRAVPSISLQLAQEGGPTTTGKEKEAERTDHAGKHKQMHLCHMLPPSMCPWRKEIERVRTKPNPWYRG